MSFVLFCVLLLFFMALSAFFSGSETALMSISKSRLRYLAKKGDRKAVRIKELLSRPERLLSSILLGNTLFELAAASMTTYFVTRYFPEQAEGLLTAVATLFITLVVLIFGEILPKTYAFNHSERLSLQVVQPLRLMMAVLSPLTRVVSYLAHRLMRLLGGALKPGVFSQILTEDEIKTLITGDVVLSDEKKRELLHGIFEFGHTQVREVMIPRPDVTAAEVSQKLPELIQALTQAGYSRVPVYRGHFDNVVGILYTKELLQDLASDRPVDLEKLLHRPHFVPDSAKIENVLRQLQSLHLHMAIVVDEFGSVKGIVTLEDILEEIVGEIHDEYDVARELVKKVSSDTFLVDGRAPIRDLNRQLRADLPESPDYTTLAGFVVSLSGRLLKEAETLQYRHFHFTIQKVERYRIATVKIKISKPAVLKEVRG